MVRPQQSRRRSKANGFSVLGERGSLVSLRREAQVQHAEGEVMADVSKEDSGGIERDTTQVQGVEVVVAVSSEITTLHRWTRT
jgi:hypothetical protein